MNKKGLRWSDRKRWLFGLPFSFTVYGLNDERIFIKRGFLNIAEDEVRLYRVMDIKLTRSLGQRMFNLGTIHICSSDKSMKNFHFDNIKNPEEVKELLSMLVETQRDKKRVVNREIMSSGYDDCENGELCDENDGYDEESNV